MGWATACPYIMIDYTKFITDYTTTRNKGRSLSPASIAIISAALNDRINERWMWKVTDAEWDALEAILGLAQVELEQPITGFSYAFNTTGSNGAGNGSIRDMAVQTWQYDDISLIASDRAISIQNNTNDQVRVSLFKDGVKVTSITSSPGAKMIFGSLFTGFSRVNGIVHWQQDWLAAPFSSGRIEIWAEATPPTTGQMDINIQWEA